ncbi:hypothetical protein KCU83_g602, partial [Aureobasidium melanogenum]
MLIILTSPKITWHMPTAASIQQEKKFQMSTLQIWASLTAYVAQPSHAAGQSNRVARLINGVARIAGNVAEATKEEEGALNHEVYTTLLEASRKAIPKSSSKRKATADQASTSTKRKKVQDIQETTPQHSSEENAAVSLGEEGVAQERHPPQTTPRSIKRSRNAMDLSPPTKDGTEWQKTWAAIVEKQPINRITNKPFVWLDNLTKVLVFMWGSSQGVNCVLKMVEAVYRDFDNLTLDAITSASNPKSSVYTLEMRYKRVLSLSKAPALQTTELLLEYKNMADDFVRLNNKPKTLQPSWAKSGQNEKSTQRKRQQIRRDRTLLRSRSLKMAKLRKMREYARNIDNMIAMFGWGVVPLLASAPWKQVFADVSNTSAQACLQELAHAVPKLRQICDRLDENFYRFLRIPGQITQLPKDCLQGMSVKKQYRLSYTIAYQFAAPGEREEPDGMLNTKHLSHAGQKKTTTTGQKEAKGAKDGVSSGKMKHTECPYQIPILFWRSRREMSLNDSLATQDSGTQRNLDSARLDCVVLQNPQPHTSLLESFVQELEERVERFVLQAGVQVVDGQVEKTRQVQMAMRNEIEQFVEGANYCGGPLAQRSKAGFAGLGKHLHLWHFQTMELPSGLKTNPLLDMIRRINNSIAAVRDVRPEQRARQSPSRLRIQYYASFALVSKTWSSICARNQETRRSVVVDAKPEGGFQVHMPTKRYVMGKMRSRTGGRDITRAEIWVLVPLRKKSRAASRPDDEGDS